jgi:hypothetical protein
MEQSTSTKPNPMAMFSLILGITSFLFILNVYYALFFGCMGILFAVLSRGSGLKMPDKAIGGFAVSVVAITLSVVLTIASFYLMIRLFGLETATDPEALRNAVMDLYNRMLNDMQAGGSAL